jgi:GcrA cell cycle regulator
VRFILARGIALSAAQKAVGIQRGQIMTTQATWTEARVQQLRAFVTEGLTCSQIADQIGVTRNAVIGKIHRLGLSPGRKPAALAGAMRASSARPRERQSRITRILRAIETRPPSPLESSPIASMTPPMVESAQRCSLLDLAHGRCRWPISDPGKDDFAFCGNDSIAGISYCVGHARMAYRLPASRQPVRARA